MTDQNTTGVSRRTIAKGVAWSVPAVAVATAAPAFAASCQAQLTGDMYVSYNTGYATNSTDYSDNLKWFSSTDATGTAGGSPAIITGCAGQTLTSITITMYLPFSGLTWTRGTGDTGAWSTPVQSGTLAGGVDCPGTYYAYTTTWTPSTPISFTSNGQQQSAPLFSFESAQTWAAWPSNTPQFWNSEAVASGTGMPGPASATCVAITMR